MAKRITSLANSSAQQEEPFAEGPQWSPPILCPSIEYKCTTPPASATILQLELTREHARPSLSNLTDPE